MNKQKLSYVVIFTSLMGLQSCSPDSIGARASVSCMMDIQLSSEEALACTRGTELAVKAVKEAHLSVLSADAQYRAAAKRAEKLCDGEFSRNPALLNSCYVGLEYFINTAVIQDHQRFSNHFE